MHTHNKYAYIYTTKLTCNSWAIFRKHGRFQSSGILLIQRQWLQQKRIQLMRLLLLRCPHNQHCRFLVRRHAAADVSSIPYSEPAFAT